MKEKIEGLFNKNLEKTLEKAKRKMLQELKDSEARYSGLYESSIDGIVSFDKKGNILDCNQAFARMLGYKKEKLCTISMDDILTKKWAKMVKEIIKSQVIPKGYSDELKLNTKSKVEELFQ